MRRQKFFGFSLIEPTLTTLRSGVGVGLGLGLSRNIIFSQKMCGDEIKETRDKETDAHYLLGFRSIKIEKKVRNN